MITDPHDTFFTLTEAQHEAARLRQLIPVPQRLLDMMEEWENKLRELERGPYGHGQELAARRAVINEYRAWKKKR